MAGLSFFVSFQPGRQVALSRFTGFRETKAGRNLRLGQRLTAGVRAERPNQRRNCWTDERILMALDFAAAELESGNPLTQREFRWLSKQYPDRIPPAAIVRRYGEKEGLRLKDLREQAVRRSLSR